MLLCLRGRNLPLAVQLSKAPPPLCRRWLFCPAAAGLYQRPPASGLYQQAPPSRPAPAVLLSALNLSTRLGLHTSSQWQKRKEEVNEGVLITTARRHWQEMKKTPKPAFVLGVAGATPFMAVPLAMCVMQVYSPGLASLQALYGACILSFLGGVRWGSTLPDNSPTTPNWTNLVTGAMLPYLAFTSLLLIENVNAAILGVGIWFGISLAFDVLGFKELDLAPIPPLWYKWLRGMLTVVVVVSLIATMGCSSYYPELPAANQNAARKLPWTKW